MRTRSAVVVSILVSAGVLPACDDELDLDRYEALLDGANEVPPNNSTATGTFTMTDRVTRFTYRITVQDLDMPTAAHIHAGAAGVNGGILVPLFSTNNPPANFSGTLVTGEFDEDDIVPLPGAVDPISVDSLRVLLRTGNAYVNVHTTAIPSGEIRGQVVPR